MYAKRIIVDALFMIIFIVTITSCASTKSTPKECYRLTPLIVKYSTVESFTPGMKLGVTYCKSLELGPLSLEECINNNLEGELPGGLKIIFEEDSVRSACEDAILSGPQPF